jgi:hypothetical protein
MLMAMRLAGDRAAEHFIRTLDPTQNNAQSHTQNTCTKHSSKHETQLCQLFIARYEIL